MSSPRTVAGRQFCCHPQSLEGYLCTHPVLPLREDESHRSVNEVTHLALLIMHWCSSSRVTDVQEALQGSDAVCLSPERADVGSSTVCKMDPFSVARFTLLVVLWNLHWYHCILSRADLCYGYTQFHSFMAEFTFPVKAARTIIIYYAWAALPGVKNRHVQREQQSRSWVARTWAAFEFVRQVLCCSAQVEDKQPAGIFGTKWALPKAKTALHDHHPWGGNSWGWEFLCFPHAALRGSSNSLLNYPFSCGDCFLAERESRVA